MGLDFLEKTNKSIRKKWDRVRVELGTADLFRRSPERAGCSAAYDMVANARLTAGEVLTVEASGTSLVARRGLNVVAQASAPPPQILQAIKDSYGIAKGTVEQVHEVAGVVEILSC